MTTKKIINICSPARSGSTLLDLILGNGDQAFSLGEVYAWFRPYRTHHFQIHCPCESKQCPWEKLKKIKEADFYNECFQLLDVDFLIDSSKDLNWVIDNNIKFKNTDIKVLNILLYKNPISFAYSFWKRNYSAINSLEKHFINYYQRFFQTNISFVSFSYDAFIKNPSDVIFKLCSVLEMPYFDGKVCFWNKIHHPLFGSKGTILQMKNSKSIIKLEKYPDNFSRIIPNIQDYCNKNIKMIDVMLKLNKYELCPFKNEEQIYRPFWYYKNIVRQKVYSYFPRRYITLK